MDKLEQWGTELGPCVERVRAALQAIVDGRVPRRIAETECDPETLGLVRMTNHLIAFAGTAEVPGGCTCSPGLVVEFATEFNALTQLLARREEALRAEFARREEAEQRLQRERDLLVAGPLVTLRWAVDDQGTVEYVSPNIAAFGYEAEDFLSGRRRYSDIVHPDDYAWLVEDGNGKAQTGLEGWTQEYRLVDAAGQTHWVRDYTHAVRTAGGAVSCYEGYIIDVTAQKQAEVELRAARGAAPHALPGRRRHRAVQPPRAVRPG